MKPGNRWGWNKGNFANEQKGGRIVPPFLLYLVNRQNKPVFLIFILQNISPYYFCILFKNMGYYRPKTGVFYVMSSTGIIPEMSCNKKKRGVSVPA